ncbi:ribokinase [Pseudoxanthomonas dokdonensis]|uniref:Ribokinase n=1 Tax=Pseudoxanthomonas dokdonensis TaxID=344882 RepID=A0A0R0CKH8_9GAMM|nr:ribokinase [Pseudoxanthomonas dokdonensis]KRG70117.1 ribokinase [Pseudoxanthomonas dokdonensis]
MPNVTIVGSFNIDHVWRCETLPAAGATIAGQYATGPGGKGFNQAIAAARAGAATRFVCALGTDAGGALAMSLGKADGLDMRAQATEVPTGTAGIYVDARGRNSIVIGAGANAQLSEAFVQAQCAELGHGDVLLAQLESPLEAVLAALRRARQQGALTLLNTAPANAPTSAELLSLADVLTPNETEFAALLARHVGERLQPEEIGEVDGNRLHHLCRELHHGSVVVTLGSLGVFVSHAEDTLRGDGKSFYRLSAEAVEAIDSTGAGDAFNGALAASLASAAGQGVFADHVRFGNRFAALSTEREGAALAMPTREQVLARFAD